MNRIAVSLFVSALILLSGCASPYIGKSREEIVGIIAKEYQKNPGEKIHIYHPKGSNYYFKHPSEILLNRHIRGYGPEMDEFDQWGILPYKKFLFDGSFCTLLTFKDDIVIKAEEIYTGGYGFKPFLLIVFLL